MWHLIKLELLVVEFGETREKVVKAKKRMVAAKIKEKLRRGPKVGREDHPFSLSHTTGTEESFHRAKPCWF